MGFPLQENHAERKRRAEGLNLGFTSPARTSRPFSRVLNEAHFQVPARKKKKKKKKKKQRHFPKPTMLKTIQVKWRAVSPAQRCDCAYSNRSPGCRAQIIVLRHPHEAVEAFAVLNVPSTKLPPKDPEIKGEPFGAMTQRAPNTGNSKVKGSTSFRQTNQLAVPSNK